MSTTGPANSTVVDNAGTSAVVAKPCHNCKRRRLRCDRSLPSCQKCIKKGEKCLGYGKLLVWNRGVASRGKMMGKSFHVPEQATTPTAASGSQELCLPRKYRFVPSNMPDGEAEAEAETGAEAEKAGDEGDTSVSINPSLVDPLFQDLDQASRFYISHFTDQMCRDLVTYDVPRHNPYRDIVPLIRDHELLLHVIVANSAIHISNMLSKGPSRFNGVPGQYPHRDALVAKQKTLQLLNQSMDNIDAVDPEVVLTAILLSINYELVSSGKDDWKVHVEGAQKLIDYFGLPKRTDLSSAMSALRDHVVSDCLIYYILGSTFSARKPNMGSTTSCYPFTDVLPLLERAEANSYMSCPAFLLHVMLSASHLSNVEKITGYEEEQARYLMERASTFNTNTWAASVQGISSHNDFESRAHVASAHKSAVCLYIHQAVPSANLMDECSRKAMVEDIIGHLSFILPGNLLLKGTSWPTFIAGAESRDPAQRAWIVARLNDLWEILPWATSRASRKQMVL
ncbi:acriflavine sensitivity control protein acr-2 [Nannizzia gypsea CBS 118893]|uniref:Acriflavine sensitivity control protein acr-2 n=1 Tax=Arthroderma gypseum (strain ATCC MYA-4604 / CBS 118893) TaxID=535722 RepID=E4V1A6_ARTGP|nr:acriflavine sensitivity control protein acr-2 [Nannizzia gypsea CBS 118893]EFR03821.1 acriflavine sensitivity control protein acr-2 [Nannizzia gypsea CBS 118893]